MICVQVLKKFLKYFIFVGWMPIYGPGGIWWAVKHNCFCVWWLKEGRQGKIGKKYPAGLLAQLKKKSIDNHWV